MPGNKPARIPALPQPIKPKLDDIHSTVAGLQLKLEETQRRADELHRKAERLHTAIDDLKEKAHKRTIASASSR